MVSYSRAWGNGGPTGTFTHSKHFAQRLRGVLSRINAKIRAAIIEKDLFNLQTESLEVKALDEQAYEFSTTEQKARAFLQWLREQLDSEFLTVVGEDNNQFIRAAYIQGIRSAHSNLRDEGVDIGQPDVEDLLNRPIHSTTLRDIYTRTFENLVGVRDDTAQAIREELTKGFAEGKNPTDIARTITGRVNSIGKHRSTLIARTEIINAHSQASLNTYESVQRDSDIDIGVRHGEWHTAEDDRVCPVCEAINGATFTISEMRDQGFEVGNQQFNLRPPAHPQCRCTITPVIGLDPSSLDPLTERLPTENDIEQ